MAGMESNACSFKNCRYNKDHSCTRPEEYEKCSRGNIFVSIEKLYEKYPDDQDIWILLQEIVRMWQCINEINAKGGDHRGKDLKKKKTDHDPDSRQPAVLNGRDWSWSSCDVCHRNVRYIKTGKSIERRGLS